MTTRFCVTRLTRILSTVVSIIVRPFDQWDTGPNHRHALASGFHSVVTDNTGARPLLPASYTPPRSRDRHHLPDQKHARATAGSWETVTARWRHHRAPDNRNDPRSQC